MLTSKDKESLKDLLKEAFPDKTNTERNEMYNTLINKHPQADIIVTMFGNHIARIGVKYPLGDRAWGRFYYVTKYDNILLDL